MTADSTLALVTYSLLGASLYAFFSICTWRMATDAGLPHRWFAWVPLLNLYLLCRVAGRGLWWTIMLCVPLVNLVFYVLMCFRLARVHGRSRWFGLLLVIPVLDLFLFWRLAYPGTRAGAEVVAT